MFLSGVHGYGFYRLGQCPQLENCVSFAVKEGNLFNTLMQELEPGDILGTIDAAMELMCRYSSIHLYNNPHLRASKHLTPLIP